MQGLPLCGVAWGLWLWLFFGCGAVWLWQKAKKLASGKRKRRGEGSKKIDFRFWGCCVKPMGYPNTTII